MPRKRKPTNERTVKRPRIITTVVAAAAAVDDNDTKQHTVCEILNDDTLFTIIALIWPRIMWLRSVSRQFKRVTDHVFGTQHRHAFLRCDPRVEPIRLPCLSIGVRNLTICGHVTELHSINIGPLLRSLTNIRSLELTRSFDNAYDLQSVDSLVSSLTSLYELNLYESAYTVDTTAMQRLSLLTHLSLASACRRDYMKLPSAESFRYYTGLKSLEANRCYHSLSNMEWTTEFIPWLSSLTHLNLGYIAHAGHRADLECVNDDLLRALARHCTHLTSLVLSSCKQFTDRGLSAMSTRLTALRVAFCSQLGDAAFETLTNLRELDMSLCGGQTRGSLRGTALMRMPQLYRLNINACYDIHDAVIASLTNLRNLNINACANISDVALAPLNQLEGLSMNDCPLITHSQLAQMTNLRKLIASPMLRNGNSTLRSISTITMLRERTWPRLEYFQCERIVLFGREQVEKYIEKGENWMN